MNDDLNERLKTKGIKVVANVGFKSDPAEALYILKVRSNLAFNKIKDKENLKNKQIIANLQNNTIIQNHAKRNRQAVCVLFCCVSVATRFNTFCFCQKGVV